MSLSNLIFGIIFVIVAIWFQIKPKTHFMINTKTEKSVEQAKKYEKSLTKNKILLIRGLWAILGLYGIYLILKSI